MKHLTGRTALLTGATGGIGPEIAKALGAKGVRLAVSARSVAALEALRADLHGSGVDCALVPADLADPGDTADLVARAEAAVGSLDIVVHNAAVEGASAFDRLTGDEIAEVVQVNLTAPLEITRRALGGMLERGQGHVVFVSSLSGFAGTAYEAPYAATKGALNAATASLRAEYVDAPVGFSLVAPGSVAERGMFARGQAEGIRVPRALRLTTPQAVARAVVRAIEKDVPQALVYPGPIRPMLALGLLAPRLSERMNERLGTGRLFRPAAEARGRA